ncbi:hydroxyacylglutathione hydrolase like protein [Verticillium longisporum]|nr:hydroxyacylglutathione hydrolase like protein [Verticillium longisporum]
MFGFAARRTLTQTQTPSIIRPRILTSAMHIQSIPMWVGSSNNYAYLVKDDKTKEAFIIDPANPEEVAPVLKKAIESKDIDLTAIVNTHHHWDHAGGNKKLLQDLNLAKLPIIGGVHICWFLQDGDDKAVFTGDTLFHGGCGRFFEGNATEMHKALNETLASLPDDTVVYHADLVSILDPDAEGAAAYDEFLAVAALKLHARADDDAARAAEVDEAFRLFSGGRAHGVITLGDLKRVAAVLNEDVDDAVLRDMVLEANAGAGVQVGVGRVEFEEVMRRAGVWR